MNEENKQYPKGHFIGLGIAIGLPLGMPIGLAIGNIALGPVIGLAVGIPIGIALEKRKNPHPRKLTENEYGTKKTVLKSTLGIGIALFIAFAMVYVLNNL